MLDVKINADTESGEEREGFVILPRDRYDNLVDIEARVSAMIDTYRVLGEIDVQTIFAILGYTKDSRDWIEKEQYELNLEHYKDVVRFKDIHSKDEVAEAEKWLEENEHEKS